MRIQQHVKEASGRIWLMERLLVGLILVSVLSLGPWVPSAFAQYGGGSYSWGSNYGSAGAYASAGQWIRAFEAHQRQQQASLLQNPQAIRRLSSWWAAVNETEVRWTGRRRP